MVVIEEIEEQLPSTHPPVSPPEAVAPESVIVPVLPKKSWRVIVFPEAVIEEMSEQLSLGTQPPTNPLEAVGAGLLSTWTAPKLFRTLSMGLA